MLFDGDPTNMIDGYELLRNVNGKFKTDCPAAILKSGKFEFPLLSDTNLPKEVLQFDKDLAFDGFNNET